MRDLRRETAGTVRLYAEEIHFESHLCLIYTCPLNNGAFRKSSLARKLQLNAPSKENVDAVSKYIQSSYFTQKSRNLVQINLDMSIPFQCLEQIQNSRVGCQVVGEEPPSPSLCFEENKYIVTLRVRR